MGYATVVADPPWPYRSPGAHLRPKREARPASWDSKLGTPGSAARYGSMSLEDLAALDLDPAANSHLYLWTTNAFMVEAHDLARAWGYEPKTILTWVKTYQNDRARVSMKTGYYFRGATEHVVFAVRGSLSLQTDDALPTAFLWPRLPHSVKPDAFYDLVERASPGPYVELFARRARFGWDYFGDQSLGTATVE